MEITQKMKQCTRATAITVIAVLTVSCALLVLGFMKVRQNNDEPLQPSTTQQENDSESKTTKDPISAQLQTLDTLRNTSDSGSTEGSELVEDNQKAETLDDLRNPNPQAYTEEEQMQKIEALKKTQ